MGNKGPPTTTNIRSIRQPHNTKPKKKTTTTKTSRLRFNSSIQFHFSQDDDDFDKSVLFISERFMTFGRFILNFWKRNGTYFTSHGQKIPAASRYLLVPVCRFFFLLSSLLNDTNFFIIFFFSFFFRGIPSPGREEFHVHSSSSRCCSHGSSPCLCFYRGEEREKVSITCGGMLLHV